MKKIIFVCTGNTCRSPMAMAVFNKLADEKGLDWVADSAGLAAYGDPISVNSERALAKIGVILNDYISKKLNYYMVDEADMIVTMTKEQASALMRAGVDHDKISVLGNGVPDPYGGAEQEYILCLDSIIKGIESMIEEGLSK